VSLHDVLDQLALAPLLDGIVTSAEAGAPKPDGAVFERAIALAGVERNAVLHIGDSVQEDVVGARRAGIEPVLLMRSDEPLPGGAPGVQTIASLMDLFPAP
jgi:putative hydrolase of the HAD superfamily